MSEIERVGWAVRLEDGSWSDAEGWNVPHPHLMDREKAEFVARCWREESDRIAHPVEIYAAPEGHIEALEAKASLPYPENRGQTHYEGCWRDRGHHNCCVDRVEALEAERDLSDDDREALRMMASTAVWISDEIDEDPEVIAKIDRAVGLLEALGVEHITGRDPDRMALVHERDELRAEVARLRDALVEIRDHAWIEYRNRGDHPYSTGVTDGHRACANIARRALNPNGNPTEEEAS